MADSADNNAGTSPAGEENRTGNAWKRVQEVAGLWGIIATLATAAFWGVWSMFAPVPNYLMMDPWTSFSISRWWDVSIVGGLIVLGSLVSYALDSSRTQKWPENIATDLGKMLLFFAAVWIAVSLIMGIFLGFPIASLVVLIVYISLVLGIGSLWILWLMGNSLVKMFLRMVRV